MSSICNFCIIAHIDHGKSTLADRFLELTGTVKESKMRAQFLDSMDLERGRGITIKMHPVRMHYKSHILNLIDTPGHIDFNYEVSRALACVEGAILLVDATKGIQAQTIHNLEQAQQQNLVIVPAINKIDSPQARVAEVKASLVQLLNIKEEDIFLVSAKNGTGVKELLDGVIERVSLAKEEVKQPLRALIFDSKYDAYKGIIAFVRVVEGEVKDGERIYLLQSKTEGNIKELGYFVPDLEAKAELKSGEIGYLATGIKEPGKVRVGDTVVAYGDRGLVPLAGYREAKPVVFASVYPENPDDFDNLQEALSKLKLSDSSFVFEAERKEALGRGFRCGFLGSLHAEIISERLQHEFALDLIISSPSVIFKIINQKGKESLVFSPTDWPEASEIQEALEPWVKLEIMTPLLYLGRVIEILSGIKAKHLETKYFAADRALLIYEVPFKEIITNFYDDLKGVSQGFASMNYELLEYRRGDLTKLEILIAGKKEEAFSKIINKDMAYYEGQKLTSKLKEVLPSQLFTVPIQAVVLGKIIARETISAKRRDVIAPLYGGDYTRKRKLLEKQKKGKQELKAKGKVNIPAKVFLQIFRET